MRFFKIIRIAFLADCVLGVILDDMIPFALTLERPWKNNQRNISCIPAGSYVCKRIQSPKFGSTFEVQKVEGRSEILFHKGNINDDTHGCILIGEMYEPFGSDTGIAASGKGFKEFLSRTADIDFFTLKIEDHKIEFGGSLI